MSTRIAIGRYDAGREDIAAIVGDGPKYRIDQIWQGMYTEFLEPLEITTISKELRTRLDTALPSSLVPVTSSDSDRGDTTKFLWQLSNGGHRIESVLMHYAERATVCVSTQAGCAMGCGFCATGQAGLIRVGEELGGIKLLQIGTNRVLIEQDAQMKELTLFSGFGSESLLPKGKTNSP